MFEKSGCTDGDSGRAPGATGWRRGRHWTGSPGGGFQSCQTEFSRHLSCLLSLPISQRGILALLSSQVMLWVASPRSGPQLQSRGADRPGIEQRGRVLGSCSSLAAAEQSHVPTRGGRGWGRAAPQPRLGLQAPLLSLPWTQGRWRKCALHPGSCRAHAHGLLGRWGTREAWRSWSEVLGRC